MFTTCTNCGSRFRLNVAQLTAAQGQVRCGKCGEVFDAYEVLEGAEVPPQMPTPAEPEIPAQQETEREEPMAAEAPETEAPEVSLHTADGAALGERRQPRTPLQDVGAGLSVEQDAERKVDLPLITVEDEPITTAPALRAGSRKSKLPIDDLFDSLPDETESEPERISALPLEADVVGSRRQPRTPLQDVGAGIPAEQDAQQETEFESISAEPALNSYAHVDLLHAPPAPKPHRPWASAGLWTLIVLSLLVLGVQLIDLDRATLSQNAVIGPSLQALYAALGRPINKASAVSDWNVGALNVTTDPDSSGALSITGSLANQAGFAQPWPLLRVVLTDRFGETLRSRDFKPADYLPQGQAAMPLGAGLAARFRLDIVDPGADAVGFSLTPCLDVPAGRVCSAANASD